MKKMEYDGIVLRVAIGSRILLLSLIVLWRSLLSPYDTSASINHGCLSLNSSHPHSKLPLFPSIGSAVERSIVWDSVYFVQIAQCGYEYEQTYAFLPLLPTLMSLSSNTVFRPLVPLIGYRAVLGLSGYMISNLAFLLAACYFYRLSLAVLCDPEASLRASVLFCLNPASIFFSSIYSESLYALLAIGGVYYSIKGAKNTSVLPLALSGSARSNGVLNAGYFCYEIMHLAYDAMFVKKQVLLLLRVLVAGLLRCIFVFLPFVAYQAYGYHNICVGRSSEVSRPWCKARVPLLYNFIQSHYWGVGFLKYFQLKQLPNFLLASPILSLAALSICSYAKSDLRNFFTLGFSSAIEEKPSSNLNSSEADDIQDPAMVVSNQENPNMKRRRTIASSKGASPIHQESDTLSKPGYFSPAVLPFVLHLAFMTATAFLVMHVQVATRFLSASPPLYWFAAYVMGTHTYRRWSYLIWAYCIAYILLGSLLFSNFYPFT